MDAVRWIIVISIFVVLEVYAYQTVRTLSNHRLISWGILTVSVLAVTACLLLINLTDDYKAMAIGWLVALTVFKLVIVLFMFGEDLYRSIRYGIEWLLSRKRTDSAPAFTARRKFLSTTALAAASIPLGGLIYGMYRGKYRFQVREVTLDFPDLPKAFDGYRITQISDIHIGSFKDHKEVNRAIDLVNHQGSDLILFTGDVVNERTSELDGWTDSLSRLSAPDGVYSVLGNHDYGDYADWPTDAAKKENLDRLKSLQRDMGWNLLLNEHRWLERDGGRLALVGVENWGSGRFAKYGDLEKASQNLQKDDFKILMSHDPSHFQEKVKNNDTNFHLTLSGHTHGMQFGVEIPGFVRWSPSQYIYKNWAGLYREMGRYIYVNRGFGFLGYPGRAGIWPEITAITLRKSESGA